jgi:hypothetical protein
MAEAISGSAWALTVMKLGACSGHFVLDIFCAFKNNSRVQRRGQQIRDDITKGDFIAAFRQKAGHNAPHRARTDHCK